MPSTMSPSSNTHFTFLFTLLISQLFFVHPFSFSISSFTPGADNILYEGDASASNGAIELVTQTDLSCRVGHASYADGVRIWDSSTGKLADFTTHFTFTVFKFNNTVTCDGFTFFFEPLNSPIPPNSAGGYLGMFNTTMLQNNVVLVEFDSYVNSRWDPPVTHVGINSRSLVSSAYTRWNVSFFSGIEANAWISYNSTTGNLSVFFTYEKNPVFMDNSSFSYIIDLKKVLPESVRIGFSASTARFTCRTSISSWEFKSTMDSAAAATGREKGWSKKLTVIAGVGSFSLLMLVMGIGYFLIRRRKERLNSISAGTLLSDNIEKGALPRRFDYQELKNSTNCFSDNMRLGQGGSGHVYKGMLNSIGRVVAVKRISSEFVDSEQIFMNEVRIISRLIHRNLVQFVGWCHEKGEFLLVYDHMSNGSLDTHLYGNRRTLPWQVRYRIAIDLASGIRYLHEDAEQSVLHRDIKPANVLLDAYFSAKLGDFGVAKLVDPRLRTQMTGHLVGTCGYWAPEYFNEGRATKESDIYSFGVVALEIACGRRTYEVEDFHMPLAKWVWQLYLEGKILDAADERLKSDFDRGELECLLKVGLWCSLPNDKQRPKAGHVIKILQGEAHLPDLPNDAHDLTFPANSLPSQEVDSTASHASSSSQLL